jgi:hypothetical protein
MITKVGGGVSFGQFWTFSTPAKEFWENPEYQIPGEFYNHSNGGWNSEF